MMKTYLLASGTKAAAAMSSASPTNSSSQPARPNLSQEDPRKYGLSLGSRRQRSIENGGAYDGPFASSHSIVRLVSATGYKPISDKFSAMPAATRGLCRAPGVSS